MTFFSTIASPFKYVGNKIAHTAGDLVNVIHHKTIIGKAYDTAGSVASAGLDTVKNMAQIPKTVTKEVPRVFSGASRAIQSVERGIATNAPKVIGDIEHGISGVASGIGNLGNLLPMIAIGLGALFVMKKA
jgi:phage-related protein